MLPSAAHPSPPFVEDQRHGSSSLIMARSAVPRSRGSSSLISARRAGPRSRGSSSLISARSVVPRSHGSSSLIMARSAVPRSCGSSSLISARSAGPRSRGSSSLISGTYPRRLVWGRRLLLLWPRRPSFPLKWKWVLRDPSRAPDSSSCRHGLPVPVGCPVLSCVFSPGGFPIPPSSPGCGGQAKGTKATKTTCQEITRNNEDHLPWSVPLWRPISCILSICVLWGLYTSVVCVMCSRLLFPYFVCFLSLLSVIMSYFLSSCVCLIIYDYPMYL